MLPADDLSVRWKVSGGLGEARNMVVEATAPGTTTADLEAVADRVEEAVAPEVVGLPVKDARLRIILTGEPVDGVAPNIARSVSLDDLAQRYGLTRGPDDQAGGRPAPDRGRTHPRVAARRRPVPARGAIGGARTTPICGPRDPVRGRDARPLVGGRARGRGDRDRGAGDGGLDG
ncbi:hypothetical protein G7085_12500 [Tessaracoccus sp. HDW20]|uniref:hypothetical protein n=1 Tax=Tessaracoccus coleopterorum TaxID=2714950 RepID=UPI0018D35BDF|nr:hypothetical protein [Tessaracoccus coleopterorum]NHB85165.1 hypothetical protein [Tessaracoccus coleopterorum]